MIDIKKLDWMSKKIEEIDGRVEAFWNNPSWENVPVLQTPVTKDYKIFTTSCCRTTEAALESQMELIEETLKAQTDYMPFLEPWHGVGVYANAFGSEYDWELCEYPQTRYAIYSVEEARNLKKPDWRKSEIMQLVIDSIKYFKSKVDDAIPISLTDTQSPLDTATLIWEISSFFAACYQEPETVHRFLDMITDLVIEFSLVQLEAIGGNVARPGHNACITRPWGRAKGIGISDDLVTVVSPQFYAEFSKPYNERIAKALGGVVVHSCGKWNKEMIQEVVKTGGIMGVELALSIDEDPNPSVPEIIRDNFKGRGIPVKARMGSNFWDIIQRVYHPDLMFVPQIRWDCDSKKRDENYEALHNLIMELHLRDR